jgi:Na+/H+ antiporter NhaD/arsenite permease-like protein
LCGAFLSSNVSIVNFYPSAWFDSAWTRAVARRVSITTAFIVAFVLAVPTASVAAPLDGATLSWQWATPFVGLLLTIALASMLAPTSWQRHYGKVTVAWSAVTVIAIAAKVGITVALAALLRTVLTDYLGFIVMLFALYTVAGGILATGNFHGSPLGNAGMLFVGTLLASVVGTTGAAMIVVRPLIRANERRRHNAHVLVFAIFLVANIGGAVTPLGNPPLFVGYLRGITFFWTLQNLMLPACFIAGLMLAIFVVIDAWLYRREDPATHSHDAEETVVRVRGWLNVPLIAAIVAATSLTAMWRPAPAIEIAGATILLPDLIRDAILMILTVASIKLTPAEHRAANGFTWGPIIEVAILFAGIFICVVPVLSMLEAGPRGAFAWLLTLTQNGGAPDNLAYFWLCGILSGVLDNAPTYLVFFELAGGNATDLMGPLAGTLTAISIGASAMGALTYVGNAPNLMIRAIAAERGIVMPSFLGFMAWSGALLLPVFALAGLVFFR